ncbi:unnamed protein product, partial [Mesorhabditis spiculigera]
MSEEQQLQLLHFMEITGEKDENMARAVLESMNFDMERAVEQHLSSNADMDDVHIIEQPREPRRPTPEIIDVETEAVIPELAPRRPAPFHQATHIVEQPSSSAGPSRNTRQQRNGHDRVLRPSTRQRPAARFAQGIDDDDDDFEQMDYDDDVGADNGTNGIPLIPSDYGDIHEAINNFVTVFDARYRNGGISAKSAPNFFHGALQDAVQQAFDPVGGGVQERRPLALYLHHDRSVAANIFPQILMSDAVSSLLRGQYVLWPWDITHPDHKNQLRDWMSIGSMDEVRQVFEFRTRNRDLFPMLLLIIKEKGTLKVAEYISGTDAKEVAVQKLMTVLDAYNQIRLNSMADEAARIERGRLLEEQRQEYEASLAADRARDEARQRAIREQQEAEEKRMQEEVEEENRRKHVEQLLPAEPAETEANLMHIKMRCPGGEQLMRRFRRAETLEMLLNYLDTKGYHTDKYKFFNSDFPKKDITTLDKKSTFNDLKWPAREQIFVEEL